MCVCVCVCRALVAGVVLLQPPSAGLGALGKGSSLLCFLLTAGLPSGLGEFLFLWDQEASCPEPKFAEAALVVVGFLLGVLGRLLRPVACCLVCCVGVSVCVLAFSRSACDE